MLNVYLRFDRTNVPVNRIPNNFFNRKEFVTNRFVLLFYNSNIKMNVFELAHQVNDRLHNGDESKFLITFAVVNEFLSSCRILGPLLIKLFAALISYGNFDDEIMSIINACINCSSAFNHGESRTLIDEFAMINYLHNYFKED